jgi:hypothetical protein
VGKKILIGLSILLIGTLGVGCKKSEGANANTNANANDVATTRPAPDDSEVMTMVDANGVKTETRTFRNNPRVAKVVVTTRDGQRTVRAYSPSGEEKEVNDGGDALEATGDKIADAAGWVADKGEDAAGKTKEGAKTVGEKTKDVGEKTVDTAKTVGEKTGEGAKTVGEKTAEGAKTVGEKTATGAKKVGRAIKKVIP